MTALRERIARLSGRRGRPVPRGSVAVLAGPPAVLAAAGAYRDVPGAALMRAVRDQFDPEHRMFPGRFNLPEANDAALCRRRMMQHCAGGE